MWRILPGLFLGNEYDAKSKRVLDDSGVTHVVNCAASVPCCFEDQLRYRRVEVLADGWLDSIGSVARFIDAGRQDGATLVHCSEARERGPTVLIAYLAYGGMGAAEAVAAIREATADRHGGLVPPKLKLLEPVLERFDGDCEEGIDALLRQQKIPTGFL